MDFRTNRDGKEAGRCSERQGGKNAPAGEAAPAPGILLSGGRPDRPSSAANRMHAPCLPERPADTGPDAGRAPQIRSVPMADLIRKFRTRAEISQAELGELLGVTRHTVGNWEGGKYRPDIDLLIPLSEVFGVTLYELLGAEGRSPDFSASGQERILLSQYRQLSPVGRRIADRMVSAILDEEVLSNERILDENAILLAHVPTAAAAGDGYGFCDLPVDSYCFVFKNGNNHCADAVMRVKGDSMLPVYRDGQLVYVQYTQSAGIGEDVICVSRSGLHIKRLGENGPYSLNKELPFGLTSPDDRVEIRGRVLGIVSETELPSRAEMDSLAEIRHKEIREFMEKHGLE